jgi:hypothetical protein
MADEPILILTIHDDMSEEDIIDLYLKSVEQAAGPVFRLFNFQEATSSYVSNMTTLREMFRGVANTSIIPEMHVAFVAQPPMKPAFNRIFPSTAQLPFFYDLSDALDYARHQTGQVMHA